MEIFSNTSNDLVLRELGWVSLNNNTAAETCASVASLEALVVATAAEIVGLLVDDDGPSTDGVFAAVGKGHERVDYVNVGDAVVVGFDVAQITDVAFVFAVFRCTVSGLKLNDQKQNF